MGYNGIMGEKGVVDTVRSWVGDDGAVAMGTVAALDLLSSSGSSEQCISSKSYVDEVGSGQWAVFIYWAADVVNM